MMAFKHVSNYLYEWVLLSEVESAVKQELWEFGTAVTAVSHHLKKFAQTGYNICLRIVRPKFPSSSTLSNQLIRFIQKLHCFQYCSQIFWIYICAHICDSAGKESHNFLKIMNRKKKLYHFP